jgi:hypothetical protein
MTQPRPGDTPDTTRTNEVQRERDAANRARTYEERAQHEQRANEINANK